MKKSKTNMKFLATALVVIMLISIFAAFTHSTAQTQPTDSVISTKTIGDKEGTKDAYQSIKEVEVRPSKQDVDKSIKNVEVKQGTHDADKSIKRVEVKPSTQDVDKTIKKVEVKQTTQDADKTIKKVEFKPSTQDVDKSIKKVEFKQTTHDVDKTIKKVEPKPSTPDENVKPSTKDVDKSIEKVKLKPDTTAVDKPDKTVKPRGCEDSYIWDTYISYEYDPNGDDCVGAFYLEIDADTPGPDDYCDVKAYIAASTGESWWTECWEIYDEAEYDNAFFYFDASEFAVTTTCEQVTLTVDLYTCDDVYTGSSDTVSVLLDPEEVPSCEDSCIWDTYISYGYDPNGDDCLGSFYLEIDADTPGLDDYCDVKAYIEASTGESWWTGCWEIYDEAEYDNAFFYFDASDFAVTTTCEEVTLTVDLYTCDDVYTGSSDEVSVLLDPEEVPSCEGSYIWGTYISYGYDPNGDDCLGSFYLEIDADTPGLDDYCDVKAYIEASTGESWWTNCWEIYDEAEYDNAFFYFDASDFAVTTPCEQVTLTVDLYTCDDVYTESSDEVSVLLDPEEVPSCEDSYIYDTYIYDVYDPDGDGCSGSFYLEIDADTCGYCDVKAEIEASTGESWWTDCWMIAGKHTWDNAFIRFDASDFDITGCEEVTLTVNLYTCDDIDTGSSDTVSVTLEVEGEPSCEDSYIFDTCIPYEGDPDGDGCPGFFVLEIDADTYGYCDVKVNIEASTGESWWTNCWTIFGQETADNAFICFDASWFDLTAPCEEVTLTVDLYTCDDIYTGSSDTVSVLLDRDEIPTCENSMIWDTYITNEVDDDENGCLESFDLEIDADAPGEYDCDVKAYIEASTGESWWTECWVIYDWDIADNAFVHFDASDFAITDCELVTLTVDLYTCDGTYTGSSDLALANVGTTTEPEYGDGQTEYWAVIVGVADYEGIGADLEYTDDDAIELYDTLLLSDEYWQADHITLLLDSDADSEGIYTAFDWLDDNEDPDDVVLFFFSGHGTYGPDDDGDELDGWDEYICPYDFNHIRDDQLDALLDQLGSTSISVIIDTCFAGGMTKDIDLIVKTLPNKQRVEISDGFGKDLVTPSKGKDIGETGRVVLMACDDDESAYETSKLENGVFSYYVIEGLEGIADVEGNGDSICSAEETFEYASPLVTEFIPGQHPQVYDGYVGELPITTGTHNPDWDGDGVLNDEDNCPYDPNTDQADMDEDGIGDVCDPDKDGDDVPNEDDNCPEDYNPGQEDANGNGIGDACEDDGWGVRLDVTCGAGTDVAEFGLNEAATYGFDPEFDVPEPPSPPPPYQQAYFYYPENPAALKRLSTSYIPLDSPYNTWPFRLKYDAEEASDVTITWNADDIAAVPADTQLFFVANSERINMRTTQSYTFSATTGTYEFEIRTGGDEYTFDLCTGWNMISFPLEPLDKDPDTIFGPDYYCLYTWDPVSGCYVSVGEVETCRGYWLLVLEDRSVTVEGDSIYEYCTSLTHGWNMIGSTWITTNVPDGTETVPADQMYTYLYMWCGDHYDLTQDIDPGLGYWALAFSDCELCVFPAPPPPPPSSTLQALSLVSLRRSQVPRDSDNFVGLRRAFNDWGVRLDVTCGAGTDVAEFGLNEAATYGFDTQFDVPEPPSPPSPYQQAYFHYPGNPLGLKRLSTSYIPPDSPECNIWPFRLKYDAEEASDVTITWNADDIAAVPANCSLLFVNDSEEIDMRTTPTYTFSATSGTYEFEIRAKTECEGTNTSCGIYPDCENCTENDGCYPYGNGCEEREYYCKNNEEGCDYTYSNRHTDEWVDTGNTRWEDVNECQEKEQKEQEYRDYACSNGVCTYSVTDTQWIDTGNTQNKPDGTDCGSDEWVDTGNTKWIDDPENDCKEKEQKEQEYRDYACSNGVCTYSVTDTQWIDTGDTKNKPDGTDCGSDEWVDTGNTRWEDDLENECKEKEQKEQEYRDYACSNGVCTYSVTDTQWIDTGDTQNKPDGTICGCTANNTLKTCYEGTCTDTGICNSTNCSADVACDGKEPGESCGPGRICNATCKCVSIAPEITYYAPESPVSDSQGATRRFNIAINQTVNVSWQIDGTIVRTNTSVTEASYTNTSAVIGTWNVSAIVTNANGTDMQTWTWTVTSPCFIATAAYGTPLDENIDILREFRDEYLMTNPGGRAFVKIYYGTSPPVANVISKDERLRWMVREGLVEPLVYITEQFVD